ncbi:MAG TPA: HAD family hydrolase [Verrucomicrobiae bacterium]|nr:HAD family hydrolase [Verrucomicrobiae bacterium]
MAACHRYFPAMIRLALFDIDGTLVRTGGAGVKAFAKVFATEFGATEGFERLKFAGRTDVSLVREFFQAHRISETAGNFERFFERYVFWLDHILSGSPTEPCPGVWKFLDDLKALPHPPLIGLLTGNIRLGAEIKLRHFGLWDEFETGAFADDHENRDQIAAIARERGCRILGEKLRDEEVLVVGDTPLDIRCGRSIRAKVLAVATGGAKLDELIRHKPDWAVPDLRKISALEICA